MAVITRYVVVRDGVELDRVFSVKKDAEAYDRMLDAADGIARLIREADLDVDIAPATVDAVAVLLAKNAPEVSAILKGVKPVGVPAAGPPAEAPVRDAGSGGAAPARKAPGRPRGAKSKPSSDR